MKNQIKFHVFIGPTGYGFNDELMLNPFIEIHPPVKRGDIDKLTQLIDEPVKLLIVDGVFHSQAAVGHVELRTAIEKGCELWGASSMGAIRAAEMNFLGMQGFGQVYNMFLLDHLDDDEVTLIHEAEAPFTPLTEPLVHIREWMNSLYLQGRIDIINSEEILHSVKSRWYGERTLNLVGQMLIDRKILTKEQLKMRWKNLINIVLRQKTS
ncbi:TfuA domain-containing protein [Acinetobacter colistiniresistens]|uniref:TfuA domain-containing protein n=1 Tax=Acinetobacter colistiniresistens TaxID=280145 RepID=UPI00211D0C47|nr:TfuA domain-containing protein [Acinetobacter colistiniresistens]UUM26854.1 TfuA domain-containing protein [Acinetobacter colistiniresistens]